MAQAACKVTPCAVIETRFEKRQAHLHAHSENQIVSKENQPNKISGCYLCGKDHKLVKCDNFLELSVQKRWDLVKNRCLCEGCLSHPKRFKCRKQTGCGVNGCASKHHELLHGHCNKLKKPGAADGCYEHQESSAKYMLFSIIPVVLHGKDKSLQTYAFLDNGSSLTLVEEEIANNLGLDRIAKPLCLKWTADTVRFEEESKIVPLEISGNSDKSASKRHWLRDVRTVKKLALPTQSINQASLADKIPTLEKLREGSWEEPVGIKTRLGWCVSGNSIIDNCENGVYHACECDKDLHEMVRLHYILEDNGIEKEHIKSAEEIQAITILEATVEREEGAFKTGLLWRYNEVILPASYPMALKRLNCLERKIKGDGALLETINKQINDLIAKGYAKKISPSELKNDGSRIWYLPVFMVENRNKQGKVRMVLDAAACSQGTSLNDLLLKGPDELTVLTDVLYSLRLKKIAIAGDIEEMFLRVKVRQEDQDCLRFLWRFGDLDREPEVFKMLVLPFGLRCAPSIAQHVKNKNAKEFSSESPEATEVIIKHHYVDDMLYSVDTVEEAIQVSKDVKLIHSRGGFNIRNWVSNSTEFLQALNQSDGSKGKSIQEHLDETKSTTKFLGLWWNTLEDTLTFSLKLNKGHIDVLKGNRIPNKRELLRVLMSVFDPLGFLSFYLVKLKVLLQDVWKLSIGWDEVIPNNLQVIWDNCRRLLPLVEDVSIPRCYSLKGYKNMLVQLHVFVDASEDAMATVAYLRLDDGNSVDCVIVGAKSKVAPLKPMSIPTLELQAAVIGSRLAQNIIRSHNMNIVQTFMWTDSRNVLSWLKADPKKLKQFVMFRVGEILEKTKLQDWRWVPTQMNVADEATKWTKLPDFEKNCRWFKGPSFLYTDEESWPLTKEDIQSQLEELRPQYVLHTDIIFGNHLVDFERFSKWKRLHRSMAYCLRFIYNSRCNRYDVAKRKGMFSSEELHQAENTLLRLAQRDSYADELAILLNSRTLLKTSHLFKFSPYIDDEGILRMKGRIDRAWFVAHETKHPVLLEKNHRVSYLIVEDYHKRFHHKCQETVVNEVRQRFWIPSLRTLFRFVRKRCPRCIINSAIPSCPEMAPLPEARLGAFFRPFTYTGVDYFGPILVQSGRKTEKRWGVLFTCLTIRAVHIELAHNLTADSCILCFRNFASRRGTPREIYSDNGTNLRGAEKELREALKQMNKDEVQRKITSTETKWFFNPPAAPHMGGSWERMIGTVKSVLKEVTTDKRLKDDSLLAALIEVEGIVNSRPLTYVPVESEGSEALTPNHFLLGSSNGSKPSGFFCDKDLLLRKSWRISQQIANLFWKRWIKEYLPTLTRRTKWFQKVKNIDVYDIVIIVDENLPRGSWPKGVVISTTKAKDSEVRRAVVRTANGVYERPAVKLAVLDISNLKDDEATDESGVSPGGEMLLTVKNLTSL